MPNADGYGWISYFTTMKTDVLNRRLRFAGPQPLDKRIDIDDPDLAIFAALDRHGPLPTNYLFEFSPLESYNAFQKRLTKLYNGTKDKTTYLIRPQQQFASFEARYQPAIYDLAPAALALLTERGMRSRHIPPRTDHFLHRFMSACVSASFELAAKKKKLRFISAAEILAHPRCPSETLSAKSSNPLSIPLPGATERSIIPDNLFGFEYPGEGFRFFALEVDRNTESIERKRQGTNTFSKKIDGYLEVFRRKLYEERWALPNLTVLTITTNANHAENIIEHLRERSIGKLAKKFLFKADPTFGVNWRVPREVLVHLLEPWSTVGQPKDISQP